MPRKRKEKSVSEMLAEGKALMRSDAKRMREDITRNQFELDRYMADSAPEFVGQFGHGYFVRRPG